MTNFRYIFLLMVLPLIMKGENLRVPAGDYEIIYKADPQGRLCQSYLGPRLISEQDVEMLPVYVYPGTDGAYKLRGWEIMPSRGGEDFFTPALSVTQQDGNTSTCLRLKEVKENGNVRTAILVDSLYPVEVRVNFESFPVCGVVKEWTEISNHGKKPVTLDQYASGMLYFNNPSYYLTSFTGDWAREAGMETQKLGKGKKILESRLGSRAALHTSPMFILALDREATEDAGTVMMGTLGWTGNFRFVFEVDNSGNLRVIPGVNTDDASYILKPGQTLKTPDFVFTVTDKGIGQGTRNLHGYLRKGCHSRPLTLLNNWESTYFDFDQDKICDLIRRTPDLGVDMFLLDDGWFGNKYPRNDDKGGLGDWQVNREKLPGGIPALVRAADSAGVKFGIWIEPEMVNPRSELMERHPDWTMRWPGREPYLYRKQLVLDMANPAVQDHVFKVVDDIMRENPEVAFMKWDCNSPIANAYSPYLGKAQGRMPVEHVKGLYNVLERVKSAYPDLKLMLCAGGGGRCDYKAMDYFDEFWCSDDTDPLERAYIQWGFSHFFPAEMMAAHVTNWNRGASLKFRIDMASMGRLGFDIPVNKLTEPELELAKNAVESWKRLQPAIVEGDMYRLVSPCETNHMAVQYVSPDSDRSVVFAYDLHPRYGEKTPRIRLKGLDPEKQYRIREINLPGESEWLMLSGDYLMKVGLNLLSSSHLRSMVIEIEEVKG